MPVFSFSAAERNGSVHRGERESDSEKFLAQSLKAEGLFLLEAREKKGISSINLKDLLDRLRPVRIVERMVFTRNLGVMIAAGLSLTKALEALAHQTANLKFRKIIEDVDNGVVHGKSFADALRSHEKVFGVLFINMIEAGEASGKLVLVLKLLANQMKRDYELRRRVKGALIYPLIIVLALIGIGIMMMVYVVPTLSQTILELGVELPFTTKLIISISKYLVEYSLLAILVTIIFIAIVWRILASRTGRALWDRLVLRLPVFGALVREFNAARFCRTLAYLVTSGVPIVRSLEISSSVLGNTSFRDAAHMASIEIQKGKQLHDILAGYPKLFEPLIIQMVDVGEETGKISDMLLRLALFYEGDVTNTTKNLSTIIEPVLMVFIGSVVAFFAISMLQPIYGSLGNL